MDFLDKGKVADLIYLDLNKNLIYCLMGDY